MPLSNVLAFKVLELAFKVLEHSFQHLNFFSNIRDHFFVVSAAKKVAGGWDGGSVLVNGEPSNTILTAYRVVSFVSSLISISLLVIIYFPSI